MLAEVTIDLSQLGPLLQWVAIALGAVGGGMFALPKLKELLLFLSKKLETKTETVIVDSNTGKKIVLDDGTRSSDQKPPEGFVEHLIVIKEVAPTADEAVWWDYATRGLTEAQAAKEEAKLARRVPSDTKGSDNDKV